VFLKSWIAIEMKTVIQKWICFVLVLICLQFPQVNAQTECQLLLAPNPSGKAAKLRSHDLQRLRSSFMPRLTTEQRDQIRAIARKYIPVADNLTNEERDDPDEMRRTETLEELSAPQILAEYEEALGELWPLVVLDTNRRLAAGYGDPSGFSLSTVVEGLEFTGQQKDQIEKLNTKVEAEQKKLKSELAEKLKVLLDEHFVAVQIELDSVQQARFLKWFGDLNLFKSLAFSDHYRTMIMQLQAGGVGDIFKERTLYQKNGKPVKPVANRKDFEIDALYYRVLTMHGINETLTLSPEQVEQIDDQIHGNHIRLILKNRRSERLQNILDDKWELPEWLDEILLPHQRTWMMQFEFQVYNLPYADSFGLLHPDVAESLKLSEGTMKRILELAQKYRTKVTDVSRKTESAIALAEKDKQTRMLKMLSPEQMHQYRLWFGDVSDH
jgi:Spy/CpxP family protein refolding chaperone